MNILVINSNRRLRTFQEISKYQNTPIPVNGQLHEILSVLRKSLLLQESKTSCYSYWHQKRKQKGWPNSSVMQKHH